LLHLLFRPAPFLRRLYNLLTPNQKPHFYIRLNNSIKDDLRIWYSFLRSYNGITYFRALQVIPSDSIPMASDASHKGFGGCFRKAWIQCPFPRSWRAYSIAFLELYPIYVMISMFGHLLPNSNILFLTDNMSVSEIINSQTSKNTSIMNIVRPLVLSVVRFNINLRSKHVPGIYNILPDHISRFKVTPSLLNTFNMDPHPTPIPPPMLPENFRIK